MRSGSRSTRRASSATTSSGAVLASDAFFPFADGPQLAFDAGVTSIIQPGGSKRDDEVIQAVEQAPVRRWSSPTAATSATELATCSG